MTVVENTPMQNVTSFGLGNDGSLFTTDYNGLIYRITVDEGTSLRPWSSDELSLYPNPTREWVRLVLPDPFGNRVEVDLFDLAGRRVFFAHKARTPAGNLELELPPLPPGLYSIRANDGRQSVVGRLHVSGQ